MAKSALTGSDALSLRIPAFVTLFVTLLVSFEPVTALAISLVVTKFLAEV
ncbi:hypothetical protein [Thiomicrorhabdus cannonii]|nr:hypothetical protein [Thiomicrorhabdus cannonii]